MSGVKVRVVVEPGDKKATLRLTHTSAEEGQEPEVVELLVGKTPAEVVHDLELQLGGKLEMQITEVVELVYDPQQMCVTEKKEEGTAQKTEPKSKGAHASGAKESSGEAQEGYTTGRSAPTSRSTTHK